MLVNFSSCSGPESGCTDPNAISYDPNAEEADGSCIYLRDKFVGNYKGSVNATDDFFDFDRATMEIKPVINNTNRVCIIFSSLREIRFIGEGNVKENQITINSTDEAASMRFCSPAGAHPQTGTREARATFIFSEDTETVTATNVSVRGIYDNYDCSITFDVAFSRF